MSQLTEYNPKGSAPKLQNIHHAPGFPELQPPTTELYGASKIFPL